MPIIPTPLLSTRIISNFVGYFLTLENVFYQVRAGLCRRWPHRVADAWFSTGKDHRSEGYHLWVFTSPEVVLPGIDQLKEQGIETLFLIVDYQMPKMSGAELIRLVKAKYPQIKCLMLSGQANAIHVDALADENYLESFLPKPWEEGDLFQLLDPVLSLKYERNFMLPNSPNS